MSKSQAVYDEKDVAFAKSFGKAIAHQRKLAGLTQVQLAVNIGIEKETLSRLENGQLSPMLARLRKLADAMGCPVGSFFLENGDNGTVQAETIADMLRGLPEEKRETLVRVVAELARVMR